MPGVSWRSWPPPELLEVPPLYVVDKLRESAPAYWDSKETANCTLFVPGYRPQGLSFSISPGFKDDEDAAIFSGPLEGAGLSGTHQGRRGSEADVSQGRMLTIRVHYEYLCQQSTLLRAVFSGGALPVHLTRPAGNAQMLPRVLPSTPNDLRLLLPLPDPVSFPFIIHFFYWGDFDVVKRALTRRPPLITIQGLWKNARYLNVEEVVAWIEREIDSESDNLEDTSEEEESLASTPPSPSSSVGT
ncbi:hypothetical protein AURDEDRAFT_180712 [Auricularia subglabra TFB-10046 SS5]|nr:hypothetical protein AURDEDRAFT_180712 [Auricularia subglabra TFB-10046 SS5]